MNIGDGGVGRELSADGHALANGRRTGTGLLALVLVLLRTRIGARLRVVHIGALVQETAFLGGAAGQKADRAWVAADAAGNLLALRAGTASIIAGGCGIVGTR